MKTALMIVSHGAKESEGKDSAVMNAERLRESLGMDVYIGYLHLTPSIKETLQRMSDDGVERAIVIPLFMYPGFIPDVKVRREFDTEPCSRRCNFTSGDSVMSIEFTDTFGNHEMIYDVIEEIIEENGGSADGTSLMLIFHGSRTTEQNADIANCASHFRGKGYDILCVYNEFQHPTVEEGMEWAKRIGKDILAIPMFVSPGTHTTQDIPPKIGLDEGERECSFFVGGKRLGIRYCNEIGMHPRVADILKARVEEKLQ